MLKYFFFPILIILAQCAPQNFVRIKGKAINTQEGGAITAKLDTFYIRGLSNWNENIDGKMIVVKGDEI